MKKRKQRISASRIHYLITSALAHGFKGEIMRLSHKGEQNDLLLLKRVHGWPIRTEYDGKTYRVICGVKP
jgi:hypothetical protein